MCVVVGLLWRSGNMVWIDCSDWLSDELLDTYFLKLFVNPFLAKTRWTLVILLHFFTFARPCSTMLYISVIVEIKNYVPVTVQETPALLHCRFWMGYVCIGHLQPVPWISHKDCTWVLKNKYIVYLHGPFNYMLMQ